MQPREFIFRLSLCPGLGPLSRVRLWRVAEQNYCFDNLELLTSQSQITPRVKESLLKNWASPYLDRLVEQNYRVPQITLLDPDYPAILREIYCPPLVCTTRATGTYSKCRPWRWSGLVRQLATASPS